MIRTYTELCEIPTFLERFRYLMLDRSVGIETFGSARWFNQAFYNSNEWRQLRREIALRDLGDLACEDHEFGSRDRIVIHHMNPIMLSDIRDRTDILMNPEYLIATTADTHRAIHYGDESLVTEPTFVFRRPNDTCPWR
jgi:hypothetical protein